MQLANAPCSFRRLDGTWEHHIRQSDINRFRKCPELQRRDLIGQVPEHEGDAALIGTAAHAGAAHALTCLMNETEPDYSECLAAVATTLRDRWELPTLRQMQIRSYDEAVELALGAFHAWWTAWADSIDPSTIDAVELPFDVVAWREPKRVVYLTGTMDLRLTDRSVIDWKFPGDRYTGSNAWKHERYDNQPTHYLWASELLAGANPLLPNAKSPDGMTPLRDEPLPDFTYGVVIRGKGIAEELEIRRTLGDIRFYRDELTAYVKLIEADLDRWPLNPTDWWCSDKWCPVWDNCRGNHMPPDPWGLMRKVAQLTGGEVPVKVHQGDDDDDSDPFAFLPEAIE